jgi:hypothetical protein
VIFNDRVHLCLGERKQNETMDASDGGLKHIKRDLCYRPGVRYDFDKDKDFLGIRPISGFLSSEPIKGPLQVQGLKPDLGWIFGDIFLFLHLSLIYRRCAL